ncbi:unnamed protein product [Oppiella nova]|uniref:Uncharacterized protein n=1 Tax=Oppiella nova TaxID=334625 RepID=A0A7R9QW03_9ACAR|nr:unnamed protein product [Oppiella nova]CAG2176405.1 unnamed protein product [Oppiella nova]
MTLDLNSKLSHKERIECEKWVKVPKYEQQVHNWTDLFLNNGYTIEMTEIKDYFYDFKTEYAKTTLPMLEKLYAGYCVQGCGVEGMSDEMRQRFKEQMSDQIMNARSPTLDRSLLSRGLNGDLGQSFEVFYKIAFIIVRKNGTN